MLCERSIVFHRSNYFWEFWEFDGIGLIFSFFLYSLPFRILGIIFFFILIVDDCPGVRVPLVENIALNGISFSFFVHTVQFVLFREKRKFVFILILLGLEESLASNWFSSFFVQLLSFELFVYFIHRWHLSYIFSNFAFDLRVTPSSILQTQIFRLLIRLSKHLFFLLILNEFKFINGRLNPLSAVFKLFFWFRWRKALSFSFESFLVDYLWINLLNLNNFWNHISFLSNQVSFPIYHNLFVKAPPGCVLVFSDRSFHHFDPLWLG